MKAKYEYLLHCWGGFWNSHNAEVHKEPDFKFKWFDSKEERDAEMTRLREIKDSHGEFLVSQGKFNDSCIVMATREGYLTRHEHIIQSIIQLPDGEIITIENNLGYGFWSDEELGVIGDGANYFKEWKYEGMNDIPDDAIRLFSTVILRL